jgi:hypothetical protein
VEDARVCVPVGARTTERKGEFARSLSFSGTSSPSHDACLCLQKRRLAAEDVRLTLQDAARREAEAQHCAAAAEATQPSS